MAPVITISTPVTNGINISFSWVPSGGCAATSYVIWRKISGGSYASIDTVYAPEDTYTDSTAANNTTYVYKVICNEGHVSNEPTAPTMWTETLTADTNSLSESFEDTVTYSHTNYYETFNNTLTWTDVYAEHIPAQTDDFEDIVVWGDWCSGSQTLDSDFVYYYADVDSNVYAYDLSFKGDDNQTIPCSYKTKKLDFADQYPQYANFTKTVYRIIVTYVDKDTIDLGVHLSADGGAWKFSEKTIGTGSGVAKRAYYHFIEGCTGQFFNLKLTNESRDKTFQILGIDIEWLPRSGAFEI